MLRALLNKQKIRGNKMENLDSNTLKYLAGLQETIKECGIPTASGAGCPAQPHSPASINITANTGDELADMLKDIMSLAGVHAPHPKFNSVLTPDAGPSKVVDELPGQMPSMQSLIKVVHDEEPDAKLVQDGMNDETRMYDNSPEEEGKAEGNWPIDGDQDNNLSANKDKVVDRNKVTAESLFAEYREFVNENKKEKIAFLKDEKIIENKNVLDDEHDHDNKEEFDDELDNVVDVGDEDDDYFYKEKDQDDDLIKQLYGDRPSKDYYGDDEANIDFDLDEGKK